MSFFIYPIKKYSNISYEIILMNKKLRKVTKTNKSDGWFTQNSHEKSRTRGRASAVDIFRIVAANFPGPRYRLSGSSSRLVVSDRSPVLLNISAALLYALQFRLLSVCPLKKYCVIVSENHQHVQWYSRYVASRFLFIFISDIRRKVIFFIPTISINSKHLFFIRSHL